MNWAGFFHVDANLWTLNYLNSFWVRAIKNEPGLLFCWTFLNVDINPWSANPTKRSNTLKQFVGKLPTNCLNVFDHFVGLALKGLMQWFLVRVSLTFKCWGSPAVLFVISVISFVKITTESSWSHFRITDKS